MSHARFIRLAQVVLDCYWWIEDLPSGLEWQEVSTTAEARRVQTSYNAKIYDLKVE